MGFGADLIPDAGARLSLWHYLFDNNLKQRGDSDATCERARSLVSSQTRSERVQRDRVLETEGHLCELAVLSKALFAYQREEPLLDHGRFDRIVASLHVGDDRKQ